MARKSAHHHRLAYLIVRLAVVAIITLGLIIGKSYQGAMILSSVTP
ncbi:MAG: hypothetical protein HY428_00865 [Candidatus Levybacteria bacterium]|nr:hypothetical protein [Candidatus Levybacteria bacterium]